MARIRHDIATLTLGQDADAETQPWQPVLDTSAPTYLPRRGFDVDGVNVAGGARPHRSRGRSRRSRSSFVPPCKMEHCGCCAVRRHPYDELFDELMPLQSPDGRDRHAVVSTHDGDWDSVPDNDGTLSLYSSRCTLHDTRTVALGGSLEIRFPGPVPDRSRPSA